MSYKPGWKTSEFYFTLVSFIFSGLFLLGVIGDNDQKEELIRDVSHGVESAILIAGQAMILYKYINSRKEIKNSVPISEETNNETNSENNSTTNQQRPNKSRNRKTNTKNKRKPRRSSKNSPS